MGLLLSVLVACVGVIELIAFYCNVKRNLTLLPIQGSLSTVREGYIDELHSLRKRIVSDLQTLQNEPDTSTLVKENEENTERARTTFRLFSHEDIEIEYNKQALARARSSSPRRFLITEKKEECDYRENSPSPRRFVAYEEPQGLSRSQCKTSLPEYLIQEQQNCQKSPNHPRYVLKEYEGISVSPIPLPSQFVVTEKSSFKNASYEIDYGDPESTSQQLYCHNDEYNKVSLSPYPSLDLPQVPRNSICNELGDVEVDVTEVDEEFDKSTSPKIDDSLSFDSAQYKENKIIIVDPRRSQSPSPPVRKGQALVASDISKEFLDNSKSVLLNSQLESEGSNINNLVPLYNGKDDVSFSQTTDGEESNKHSSPFDVVKEEVFQENTTYDENYLNNLDGVSKQKYLKRNCSSRKTIRRKNISTNYTEKPSCSNFEETAEAENTTKVLVDVAKELKNATHSTETKESSTVDDGSKSEEKKEPEPFWVNH